jgi:hypothetical protein
VAEHENGLYGEGGMGKAEQGMTMEWEWQNTE